MDNHSDPWYLSVLTADSALEIDNYLTQGTIDFRRLRELEGALEQYRLQDTDNALTVNDFPYLALWRSLNSDNSINTYSELASRMNLLRLILQSQHLVLY